MRIIFLMNGLIGSKGRQRAPGTSPAYAREYDRNQDDRNMGGGLMPRA